MTGHGFRAMAATLLNEIGMWHADAIERQLAHCDANAVRRAYRRVKSVAKASMNGSDCAPERLRAK